MKKFTFSSIQRLSLAMALLFALASCGEKAHQSEAKLTAGHWGELSELDGLLPSKAYLIDLRENDTYKVCYQASLAARWPQFESELKVALSHWSRYIGVTLTLEVEDEVFPTLLDTLDASEALTTYKKSCPDADLIVAEFDLKGPLAQVLQSYSYQVVKGKKKIVSFNKGLFIQRENENFNWITLAEAIGPSAIENIQETLQKRDQYYVKRDSNDHLLLTTLLHEAGHVWGLCDQYELTGGQTNCHPEYSTSELIDESIMAREPVFIPLFLRDDDIKGIRHLAKRRRKESVSLYVPPEASPLDYKILVIEKKKDRLILKVALNKNEVLMGMLELKIFDEQGDYNTLTAEIKTKAQEEEHYETIELALDPRWQLTSASFIDSKGEEHLVSLD